MTPVQNWLAEEHTVVKMGLRSIAVVVDVVLKTGEEVTSITGALDEVFGSMA